jgi:hypothetical protein
MADEKQQPIVEEGKPTPARDSKPTMAIKVYAPFKVYFEGEA